MSDKERVSKTADIAAAGADLSEFDENDRLERDARALEAVGLDEEEAPSPVTKTSTWTSIALAEMLPPRQRGESE